MAVALCTNVLGTFYPYPNLAMYSILTTLTAYVTLT